jgi:hypothetical protein
MTGLHAWTRLRSGPARGPGVRLKSAGALPPDSIAVYVELGYPKVDGRPFEWLGSMSVSGVLQAMVARNLEGSRMVLSRHYRLSSARSK